MSTFIKSKIPKDLIELKGKSNLDCLAKGQASHEQLKLEEEEIKLIFFIAENGKWPSLIYQSRTSESLETGIEKESETTVQENTRKRENNRPRN